MNKIIQETVQKIKELKIQGASNIRNQAVQAIQQSIQNSNQTTFTGFKQELKQHLKALFFSRPTEPGMQSALRQIYWQTKKEFQSLNELKKDLQKFCTEYLEKRKNAAKQIALNGAKIIKKNSILLTHCHSKNVSNIFCKAFDSGKIERVYCTETRPLFQGRITAKELSSHGIPVTQIVDSNVFQILPKINYFFSGADAITVKGELINKIGTQQISFLAKQFNIPHFVATSSEKFDAQTFYGKKTVIEERSWKEVWLEKPSKLSISNPAFDLTPSHYLKSIVTEKGIHSPKKFTQLMVKEMNLKNYSLRELDLNYLLK